MNAYENDCTYNLAETCVCSLSVGELLALSGQREAVLEELAATRLTYGDIEGSPGCGGPSPGCTGASRRSRSPSPTGPSGPTPLPCLPWWSRGTG